MEETVTELTLWEEIVEYLHKNYFSASVGDNFTYLQYTQNAASTLFIVMVGLCLGMLVACFMMLYQRNRMGKFIRALLKEEAHAPDTAKSLAELQMEKNGALRFALSTHSPLRRMVHIVTPTRILIRDLHEGEITEEMQAEEWAKTAKAKKEAEDRAKEERKADLQRRLQEGRQQKSEACADVAQAEVTAEVNPIEEAEQGIEETVQAQTASEGADASAACAEESSEAATQSEPPAAETSAADTADAANAADTEKTTRYAFLSQEWWAAKRERDRLNKLPKCDFSTAKFYIPSEKKFTAETRFSKDKNPVPAAILATVLFTALAFLLIRFAPLVVGLLDSTLQTFFG